MIKIFHLQGLGVDSPKPLCYSSKVAGFMGILCLEPEINHDRGC